MANLTALTTIPDDFGDGGKGLCPKNGSGSPNLKDILQEHKARIESLDAIFNLVGSVPINLHSFREVNATGDVSNIAGNGGILASDTTPVLDADANNSHEITWATGNADPIGTSFALPADFDDTLDAVLELDVSSGAADAATMDVRTSWNGGAEVTDSASDAATKSATPHAIKATIATADIPAGSKRVTIRLTPPAHATNTITLYSARLNYFKKVVSSL
jgi:hypothetical protein